MKASEMIQALQELQKNHGDKNIIFESNRHRFDSNTVVNTEQFFIIPLLDKKEI